MIKFSVSHSKIFDSIKEGVHNLEHAVHLDKITSILEHAGAEVVDRTHINVTAVMVEEKFHAFFQVAEHELQYFYGEVKLANEVLHKWIDHLEHHAYEHHQEYC